jgi:hemolysin III
MKKKVIKIYSESEENWNIRTHFTGLIISVLFSIALIAKAIATGTMVTIFSSAIFGLSAIGLYLASTLYHSEKNEKRRLKFKIFDHIAIYVLIAGSYTPFVLVKLQGTTGILIFAAVWSIALVGSILKFFFAGRLSILSTISYVLMGWIIVFAYKPLSNVLPEGGVFWLVAGGIAYTVGALLYQVKKINYNHAIFHVFVVVGTICHFISVYYFVV